MKIFNLFQKASLLSLLVVVFALAIGCTRQAAEEDNTDTMEDVTEEQVDVMMDEPAPPEPEGDTAEAPPAEDMPAEGDAEAPPAN